jgi:hypothetical protein
MTMLTYTRGPYERARGTSRSRSLVGMTSAFSSEVETASRQENASNQKSRASFRFHRDGKGLAAHLATIRRFCLGVVTVLAAGVALAAIMALKVIVYLPRFHY